MIKELTYDGAQILFRAGDTSLRTTKAFTHGSIVFDTATRSVVFGQMEAVPIPDGIVIENGAELRFQLVAPDGALRKQTRSGVLRASEKQPNLFRIAGMSQTPRRFPTEEGWSNEIYKYRAYFFQTESEGGLPSWLTASIKRQKAFWNRLAWLCREARRQCSSVPSEEVAAFVNETILPAIDAFNDALGRSKEKMKHPAKLKIEMPGFDGIWKFVGELRGRIQKGRKVPPQLLERTIDFAQQYKPDYVPLNEFINNFQAIAEKEAAALGLRRFEIRPVVTAFKTTLKRRKAAKAAWSDGWPLIKYPDSPGNKNWGIHYYFNKAGVASADLESGSGVPGMSFGPPLAPSDTGHWALKCPRRSMRSMRHAEISIPDENKSDWSFRFCVLQHRPLPAHSHLKEWKLIFQNGALWLCLVVERQRPVAVPGKFVAGLEVGWRRTEDGIRFGTLYEPATKTVRELTINLERMPKDPSQRTPFEIYLGPSRWTSCHKKGLNLELIRVFPEWKLRGTIPDRQTVLSVLQQRRDYLKDTAKIQLGKHLGEQAPPWLEKAGRRGLLKLQEELKDDPAAQALLGDWRQNEELIGKLVAAYAARSTQHLKHGQAQVAHDVCRFLKEKGINRLVVEPNFLAKVAQEQDNDDPVSLKRSQKYRQFAAPKKFLAVLKNTAVKYGIAVEEHIAVNISRICHFCDYLNPATEKEQYQCAGCGRLIKQDQNAAMNLARFAADPELAEMALQVGRQI